MWRLVVVDSYVSAARSAALYSNLLASLAVIDGTTVYPCGVGAALAYDYVVSIDAIGTAVSTVGEKDAANVADLTQIDLPPIFCTRLTSRVRAGIAGPIRGLCTINCTAGFTPEARR